MKVDTFLHFLLFFVVNSFAPSRITAFLQCGYSIYICIFGTEQDHLTCYWTKEWSPRAQNLQVLSSSMYLHSYFWLKEAVYIFARILNFSAHHSADQECCPQISLSDTSVQTSIIFIQLISKRDRLVLPGVKCFSLIYFLRSSLAIKRTSHTIRYHQ